jgi:hypothetical protein
MQVGFSYGALSDSLETQANNQGFTLGKQKEVLEQCMDAIMRLRFGIDVPDSIHNKLIERLNKKVVKSLKKKDV